MVRILGSSTEVPGFKAFCVVVFCLRTFSSFIFIHMTAGTIATAVFFCQYYMEVVSSYICYDRCNIVSLINTLNFCIVILISDA